MFATLEEKLIVGAVAAFALLVGIIGYTVHERHQGATVCVQQDESAALKQSKQDAANANAVVTSLRAQLDKIPDAAPGAVPMLVCKPTRSVSQRPATRGVEPQKLSDSGANPGMQTGVERGTDIGPGVQDITLGGVLAAADAQDLFDLMQREASK